MTPVRLEPAALRSRVKHSTTEPLRSLPDIDGKQVIYFSHKIFLEKMTNHLEIKNVLSQNILESLRKIQNYVELSFLCQ